MTSVLLAFELGEALLAGFMTALVVGWLLLLGLMLIDMFRDPALGTGAKVGWVALMVVVPFLGIFTYLLVRGDAVGRRIGAARASEPRPDAS